MRVFLCLTICAALVAMLFVTGCGSKEDEESADKTSVKTMNEYREEAAKEVDENNPEGEYEKIKREIEADTD